MKHKIINEERKNFVQERPLQVIATAQLWTDNMRKFVKKWMDDTYVCIGSYMEAAAFSRFNAIVVFEHSSKKKGKVLGS